MDKGLFPKAFCKIVPDILSNDPSQAIVMHADGACHVKDLPESQPAYPAPDGQRTSASQVSRLGMLIMSAIHIP
eukprot:2882679-Amphidinium_carterae.1